MARLQDKSAALQDTVGELQDRGAGLQDGGGLMWVVLEAAELSWRAAGLSRRQGRAPSIHPPPSTVPPARVDDVASQEHHRRHTVLTRTRQNAALVVAAAWLLGFVLGPLLHLAQHQVAHTHHAGGTHLTPHAHTAHDAGHDHDHRSAWTFAPRGPWSDATLPTLGMLPVRTAAAHADDAMAAERQAPASSPTPEGLLHGAGAAAHLAATLAGGTTLQLLVDVRTLADLEPPVRELPVRASRPWRAVPPARGPPSAA